MADIKSKKAENTFDELLKQTAPPNQSQSNSENDTPASSTAFEFTMRGEYYALTTGGKITKHYSNVKCLLPPAAINRAMSYIKCRILPKVLPKIYSDYSDLRTFHIQKVKAPSVQAAQMLPIDLMDKTMLTQFIDTHELPINASLFSRAVDLKKAILDYKDNPARFKETHAKFSEKSMLLADLDALNGTVED